MASAEITAATFIVRLSRDASGALRGIVERAATGIKQPVDGYEAIGSVIATMLDAERPLVTSQSKDRGELS